MNLALVSNGGVAIMSQHSNLSGDKGLWNHHYGSCAHLCQVEVSIKKANDRVGGEYNESVPISIQ